MTTLNSRCLGKCFVLLAIFGSAICFQSKTFADGVVTVSVSKSGDVSFSGDNGNNEIRCQIVGQNFRISGLSGTRVIAKLGNFVVGPVSVLDINLIDLPIVRNLSIDLKAGNNSFLIFSMPSLVSGNFNAKLGKGENVLFVGPSNAVEVLGNVKISGASTSESHFVNLEGNVLIGGSMAISLKSAYSELEIIGFEVLKSLSTSLSGISSDQVYRMLQVAGTTKIQSRAMNSDIEMAHCYLDGAVSLTAGKGSDWVRVVGNFFWGDVDVKLGDGNDLLNLQQNDFFYQKKIAFDGGKGINYIDSSLNLFWGLNLPTFKNLINYWDFD
jgi:hypothetical protein